MRARHFPYISRRPGVCPNTLELPKDVADNIVLNIMRECARIDDPTARLACYDNNIRAAGGNPNSVPGQMGAPSGGSAVEALVAAGAGGFVKCARHHEVVGGGVHVGRDRRVHDQ